MTFKFCSQFPQLDRKNAIVKIGLDSHGQHLTSQVDIEISKDQNKLQYPSYLSSVYLLISVWLWALDTYGSIETWTRHLSKRVLPYLTSY